MQSIHYLIDVPENTRVQIISEVEGYRYFKLNTQNNGLPIRFIANSHHGNFIVYISTEHLATKNDHEFFFTERIFLLDFPTIFMYDKIFFSVLNHGSVKMSISFYFVSN